MILKNEVKKNQDNTGIDNTTVDKNIGDEPWSAPPIPSDIEYTKNLVYKVVASYD